jgi:xylulokinase
MGDCWTLGGATGMTGGAVSWWAQLLGLGTPAAMMVRLWPQMDAIGPGADGVQINPSLSGSRFPRCQPAERGSVHGLDAKHGPAHLMRAVVEAVAYVVRAGVDVLAEDEPDLSIVLAGGTARSPELSQLRADILGRDVLVCADPDVSLKGAALLALVGIGSSDPDDPALRSPLHLVQPDRRRAKLFDELYARWRTISEPSRVDRRTP